MRVADQVPRSVDARTCMSGVRGNERQSGSTQSQLHARTVTRLSASLIFQALSSREAAAQRRPHALPPDGDPRWMIGVATAVAAVAGLLLVGRIVRRRRAPSAAAAMSRDLAPDDAYRLDEELALVD
jgi:hypothetical protein